MVEESTPEELEPLFDYTRVQPVDFVYLDDDDVLDSPPIFAPKRKRIPSPTVEKEGEDCKIVDFEGEKEKDEEDWLPPPPKMPVSRAGFEEDPTIKELRLKKQELASFAQSAEDVMRAVEESARKEISKLGRTALEPEGDHPSKVTGEREKIVITIQDKDEQRKFCVFKDDRFERLFKVYAEKTKSDIESLVFCFDGDKVNHSSSPKSLDLEDEDIIEVHHKSSICFRHQEEWAEPAEILLPKLFQGLCCCGRKVTMAAVSIELENHANKAKFYPFGGVVCS